MSAVAVVPDGAGGAWLRDLDDGGRAVGSEYGVGDLAAAVRGRAESVRWVWPSTAEVYPALVRAGVRVDRCHDVELTEALLLGAAGRWGEPRGLPAAWARLTGAPVPPDPPARPPTPPRGRAGHALRVIGSTVR